MEARSEFIRQLWREIGLSFEIINQKTQPLNLMHALRIHIKIVLYRVLGIRLLPLLARKNKSIRTYLAKFSTLEELHSWLGDDYSKKLLIKLISRRMLGGVSLLDPLMDTRDEDIALESARKLIVTNSSNTVMMGKSPLILDFYDLSPLGYDLKAHLHPLNVTCTFIFEQYRYKHNLIDIGVGRGDIAIDAGGCWGDTALYLASKGVQKVYSLEFIVDNLKIFRKNIEANQEVSKPITIIENAVWDRSDVNLQFTTRGPASEVTESASREEQNIVRTIAIDTLVQQQSLKRVDFIKMDIEGSELKALRGATRTIKEFGPKLAIAVYHKDEDLFTIPHFLKSIRPDYVFYLDHFTTSLHETVLFAVPATNR